jgi:hypothetical protein
MYQEPGDNCYDEEIGWYPSPFSSCEEPENEDQYKCFYCSQTFTTPEDRTLHEETCGQNPATGGPSIGSNTTTTDGGSAGGALPSGNTTFYDISGGGVSAPHDFNWIQWLDSICGTATGSLPNQPNPMRLICQSENNDCVPTAISNANIFNGSMNRMEAEYLWERMKDDYEQENNIDFSENGTMIDDIPALMESHGYNYQGDYDYQSAVITAIDQGKQVIGIRVYTPNDKSHAVNIVGYEKNGGDIKYTIFDPGCCLYTTINSLFIKKSFITL